MTEPSKVDSISLESNKLNPIKLEEIKENSIKDDIIKADKLKESQFSLFLNLQSLNRSPVLLEEQQIPNQQLKG